MTTTLEISKWQESHISTGSSQFEPVWWVAIFVRSTPTSFRQDGLHHMTSHHLQTYVKKKISSYLLRCAPVGLNSLRRNSQNVELDKIWRGELTPSLETFRRVGDGENSVTTADAVTNGRLKSDQTENEGKRRWLAPCEIDRPTKLEVHTKLAAQARALLPFISLSLPFNAPRDVVQRHLTEDIHSRATSMKDDSRFKFCR